MEKFEQIFAIVALFQGGAEITLSGNLTFDQCTDKVEIYMQAANNYKGADVTIICTNTGGQFVTL
jgi:hypothetical protein